MRCSFFFRSILILLISLIATTKLFKYFGSQCYWKWQQTAPTWRKSPQTIELSLTVLLLCIGSQIQNRFYLHQSIFTLCNSCCLTLNWDKSLHVLFPNWILCCTASSEFHVLTFGLSIVAQFCSLSKKHHNQCFRSTKSTSDTVTQNNNFRVGPNKGLQSEIIKLSDKL